MQCSCLSVIAGGKSNNLTKTNCSIVGGGCFNRIRSCASGCDCFNGIFSGQCNTIGGGCALKTHNVIAGGFNNHICSDTNFHSCHNFIGGGCQNLICDSNRSFIGGGNFNKICGSLSYNSGIVGGYNNTICGQTYSFILGCLLTATTGCTTYMNNATIACHLQVGGTTTLNTTTGRIDATNDVVSFSTSDKRLKCNIKPIENSLCKIIGVKGYSFDWKKLTPEEIKTIHGNSGKDVGVIAQEIEKILPEAVTIRDNGYKAVNYEKIIPLLIEAIKEQQNIINELKSKIQ